MPAAVSAPAAVSFVLGSWFLVLLFLVLGSWLFCLWRFLVQILNTNDRSSGPSDTTSRACGEGKNDDKSPKQRKVNQMGVLRQPKMVDQKSN